MSARILSLDRLADRRPSPEPVLVEALLDRAGGVCSWLGASGQRYAHSIFSLIECPPLPKVAYALVRRDANGTRKVLQIASGTSDAPTLNLARIRQRGAMLGANEVHVHALAQDRRRAPAGGLRPARRSVRRTRRGAGTRRLRLRLGSAVARPSVR